MGRQPRLSHAGVRCGPAYPLACRRCPQNVLLLPGLQSGDWTAPDHLYAVMVPKITPAVCRDVYASQGFDVDDTMICAGVGGKDSCQVKK